MGDIQKLRLASVSANLRRASLLFDRASQHYGRSDRDREQHGELIGAAKWHLDRALDELSKMGVPAQEAA